MRVLTPKDKVELFVVAPVLFFIGLAIFVYSVRQESVDVGYLIACLMFSVGSGISISRHHSLVINLMVAAGAMQLTQLAFFNSFDLINERVTLTLQYISIYLLSLVAVTNITWFLKGKPKLNNHQGTT